MSSSRQLIVNADDTSGLAVIYIMSRDQRVQDNHALLAAQARSLEHKVPLYVLFVLKNIKTRSREQYQFMLEGLEEVSDSLTSYGIQFVLRRGNPAEEIAKFTNEAKAGALYFDFSPLKRARSTVKKVASHFNGSVIVVDTHNCIPVWVASDKKEFAAHAMRTKVHKKLEKYLVEPPALKKQTLNAPSLHSLSFKEAYAFTESIALSGTSLSAKPGEKAALAHAQKFITNDLVHYGQNRNNIATDYQSGLSPYLHFGQISSLRVALCLIDSVKQIPLLLRTSKLAEHGDEPSRAEGMDVLLEEMIVRKELSDNFCFFSDEYVSIKAAPEWAQKSLQEHSEDTRDFIYTTKQWESAATHDEAWNAAQIELLKTGKIHGYMRMYWAKKLLEWSASPDQAIQTAVYLNDKYSIDGGDPNGYVGILWSIAGLHDRPWFERSVFGKIRYMNASGLRRKFSVDEYINRIQSL